MHAVSSPPPSTAVITRSCACRSMRAGCNGDAHAPKERGWKAAGPGGLVMHMPQRQWDGKQQALRTCAAGNSLVRSVSCVASPDSRFGRLSTKAAWSCVAPQAVMR